MTISLTSPVTGNAQTGLTSPTYTHVQDQSPDVNAKQYAVTALGGTQSGVTTHTVASPFTFTAFRPKVFKVLGKPHPVTGLISQVPKNVHKYITRKGVTPQSGQPFSNMVITTIVEVPAGSDTADAANVRAALSFHFGSVGQQSAGIGDTIVTGVM